MRNALTIGSTHEQKTLCFGACLYCGDGIFVAVYAQEKKLEKIRVGGGSVGAPQMTMWFAKEANLYEKHGLAVEAISIPGSSMALQAMLSDEVPIIQLGGTASLLANFAGADTVIVATVLKRFLFSIFRMASMDI